MAFRWGLWTHIVVENDKAEFINFTIFCIQRFPYKSRPLYSMTMDRLILCFSGFKIKDNLVCKISSHLYVNKLIATEPTFFNGHCDNCLRCCVLCILMHLSSISISIEYFVKLQWVLVDMVDTSWYSWYLLIFFVSDLCVFVHILWI